MNKIAVILGIILALSAVGDNSVRVAIVFKKAPVEQVAALYSDLTGNKVEVEPGVHAKVSLRTEADVTKGEAIRLVEEALREQNVGLFPKAPNILAARWMTAKSPQGTPAGLSPPTPIVFGTTTNGDAPLSYEARRAARDRFRQQFLEARAARTNGSGVGAAVSAAPANVTDGVLDDGNATPMAEEGPNKEPKATP